MQTQDDQSTLVAKFIVVGDSSVGKSSIILRYTDDIFDASYTTTIGVDFRTKNIPLLDDESMKLQIWDTAGAERFRGPITRAFYRASAAALIVYDVNNRGSFRSIEGYLKDVRSYCPDDVVVTLVGAKTDLEDQRQVTTEEGRTFAEQHDLLFIECSSKTGIQVNEVFSGTAHRVYDKIVDGTISPVANPMCGVKVNPNLNGKWEVKAHRGHGQRGGVKLPSASVTLRERSNKKESGQNSCRC